MAENAANVQVGYDGEVFFAPAGTTLPLDATTALDAAFTGFGFLSSDGFAESLGETWTNIRAWQRGQIVRKIRTESDPTFELAALETNPTTLAIWYGNYSAGGVKVGGQPTTRGSWVFEVLDGDQKLRGVIPDGEVSGRGTHTFKTDDGIMYPFTVSAYPDATLDANAIWYRAVLP